VTVSAWRYCLQHHHSIPSHHSKIRRVTQAPQVTELVITTQASAIVAEAKVGVVDHSVMTLSPGVLVDTIVIGHSVATVDAAAHGTRRSRLCP
jgi:hypothetical protein